MLRGRVGGWGLGWDEEIQEGEMGPSIRMKTGWKGKKPDISDETETGAVLIARWNGK